MAGHQEQRGPYTLGSVPGETQETAVTPTAAGVVWTLTERKETRSVVQTPLVLPLALLHAKELSYTGGRGQQH